MITMGKIESDTPPGEVSESERERLYDKFGKPPKRDEPLEISRNNLVYVCSAGGPIYKVYRGRVTNPNVSDRKLDKYSKSIATDDGVREDGDRMVKVRTGTATMESVIVPIKRVLEVIGEDAEYVASERYYTTQEKYEE